MMNDSHRCNMYGEDCCFMYGKRGKVVGVMTDTDELSCSDCGFRYDCAIKEAMDAFSKADD